jgi:hypothetical protein
VTHTATSHAKSFAIDGSSTMLSFSSILRAAAYVSWRAAARCVAMRPSLYWVSWKSPIGLPNCLRSAAYVAVVSSAACATPLARRRSGAPGREAGHLQVEALPLARRLADQVRRRTNQRSNASVNECMPR